MPLEKLGAAELVSSNPLMLLGKRVLVVDDVETNTRIILEQLQAWGCEARSARSPWEALEILHDESIPPFDAALLDMQMPEMDGEALARLIKNDPATSDIALVLVSSAGVLGSSDELAAKGFAAGLAKPVRRQSLFTTLLRILGNAIPPQVEQPAAAEHQLDKLQHGLAPDDAKPCRPLARAS